MKSKNYEFWKQQAISFKEDVKAVNYDIIAEQLELIEISKIIKTYNPSTICDLGCGNGRTIVELADNFRDKFFHGFDYVDEMIENAMSLSGKYSLNNVSFYVCDATSKDAFTEKVKSYDMVLSKRLIINVLNDISRDNLLQNIYSILKDDGIYVMVECFVEPLDRVNGIRRILGLDEIKVKEFNRYLDSEFISEKIEKFFAVEDIIPFESFYYFISRIMNAYLSKIEGKEPEYTSPINLLSLELSKLGIEMKENYGPEIIYILRKK